MEFKAPASHRPLLLLRLLLLLMLAYIPFTMADTVVIQDSSGSKPIHKNPAVGFGGPPAPKQHQSKTEVHSVSCPVPELQCQPCPSVFECPSTFQPETFKELKNNLGPVIHQRLMELLEKTHIVESAFEVVQTIDMLKLLDESNSEFNVVREHMHNGAQRLREASQKLLGKKLQPQYVPQNKAAA
ncbi:hypothetical protein Vadar_016975 [Vaccinium darrowii]|uniref:Uncharacterized protein n=1 Tax=Vaccinium darrowii TaxID=229202 RepID=A0ACB7ZL56_9ERIC|nr:hypothetical protein Vadar_016975 [Vaccinium darrowii]